MRVLFHTDKINLDIITQEEYFLILFNTKTKANRKKIERKINEKINNGEANGFISDERIEYNQIKQIYFGISYIDKPFWCVEFIDGRQFQMHIN